MEKTVRTPKQKRGILMKEKILCASMELICEKGFFETTTNEIAKAAGISIGSLYSYFSDKDTILEELLERHHQYFSAVFKDLQTEMKQQLYEEDMREWLRCLVRNLVDLHTSVKEFNKVLNVLYYTKPAVAAMLDAHMEEVRMAVRDLLKQNREVIMFDDTDAAAVILVDFINALVDRIVFSENSVDDGRIMDMGVEALYRICSQAGVKVF